MVQLIDKAALVAEIESKIEKYTKRGEESDAKRDGYGMYWGGVLSCLNEVRTLCDTFETKEVDLNRESAWKPADGDELPEIDREVIALIPAYDGWKVVFAHRPDPVGYWGKSVLSDEYKHFLPETYDGWNIPNIKWWLDLDLPKTDE
jgi:hypothetical protein